MIKQKNSRNFKIKLIIKKRGSKQLKNKVNLNLNPKYILIKNPNLFII